MSSELKEVNTGWRSILTKSLFYKAIQMAFSGNKSRKHLYNLFVAPVGVPCHVLDVGCGPGHMAGLMPDSVKYTGFDISQDYIETATKSFSEQKNIKFICSDTYTLLTDDRIPNNSIDVITIHGVLHHVPDKVAEEFFMLARQKLKIGGTMAVLEPVWLNGKSPLRRFVMGMDRGKNIKSINGWEQIIKDVSEGWASSSFYIEENIVRLYYLIIYKITKQND